MTAILSEEGKILRVIFNKAACGGVRYAAGRIFIRLEFGIPHSNGAAAIFGVLISSGLITLVNNACGLNDY